MRFVPIALTLSLLWTASGVAAAPSLDTVRTEVTARVAELGLLPAPDKAEEKEAKHLAKALAALLLYTGADDKTDLKKGLSKCVKHLERSGSTVPEAPGWLDALRAAHESAADAAAAAATAARDALVTPKYRDKINKQIAKALAKRAKADPLWAPAPGKASRALVKAILKLRRAEAKAVKLHAKEGGGGPQPVTIERAALALVLDAEGHPVPHARVGGETLTDENGVAVGDLTPTASGWLEVHADGHTRGYAQEAGELNGSKLYLARVTAEESLVHLDTGDLRDIGAGGQDPRLTAELSAADFDPLPAAVSMTEIEPLDAGPLFAPFPGHADHTLRIAFAFEVSTLDGADGAIQAGSVVAVSVEDDGELGDTPVLGRFDAVTGSWDTTAGSCVRADAEHVRCDLSSAAPLLGLFAPGPAPLAAAARAPSPADLAFWIAQAEFARAVGQSLDPPNDPDVAVALAALAQAARDLAAQSPDEKGKFALLTAALAARSVGDDTLADALEDEALALAELIALALLQTNDCGYVEVMYAAAAQLDMLGGSSTVVDQLLDEISELRAECGRWVGSVHFFLNISQVHPGLDDLTLIAGFGAWHEHHFIVIEVDPKTGSLTATDQLQHSQFPVLYADETAECPITISFTGQPTNAALELGHTGSWSPGGFSIGPPSLASGSPPSITQRQHFEDKVDEVCQTIVDVTYPFPNHISLMAHGLWDATPVVSLEEMMNSGGADTGSVQGFLPFTNPLPDGGKYPFEWGTVSWSFQRVR